MNLFLLLSAFFALLISILFSAQSYALRLMSRVDLERELTRRGHTDPAILEEIWESRYHLGLGVSTLRMAINVLIIVLGMVYLQERWYFLYPIPGQSPQNLIGFADALKGTLFSLLISVPLLIIFSIAVPLAWAKYAGESLIAFSWPMLLWLGHILHPIMRVMDLVDELIRRLAGVTESTHAESEAQQVEDDIMAAVSEGAAEGMVDEDQKKMIEGVISFRDLQVGQIMTPRTEIIALDVNATLAEVQEKVIKDGLSRIPIYEETLDNIVGILYAKDLVGLLNPEVLNQPAAASFSIRKLMHPPVFVPRTKPLRDLMKELKTQQVHLAIVLDEYGGTSGLVTNEDIVEEIVGDITDEYERPAPAELKRLDPHTVEVDARMNLTELNRQLELSLPEDQEYQTLAGFVISELGVIPQKGEKVNYQNLEITVLESEPRRIKRLRIILPDSEAHSPALAK